MQPSMSDFERLFWSTRRLRSWCIAQRAGGRVFLSFINKGDPRGSTHGEREPERHRQRGERNQNGVAWATGRAAIGASPSAAGAVVSERRTPRSLRCTNKTPAPAASDRRSECKAASDRLVRRGGGPDGSLRACATIKAGYEHAGRLDARWRASLAAAAAAPRGRPAY
jgi:hypothetical protein